MKPIRPKAPPGTRHFPLLCLAALLGGMDVVTAGAGEGTGERQETVCAVQLDPRTAAYEVWGAGRQRRAFANELLPACFERTLEIEEFSAEEPLRWVFTGPRAGVTVFIRTNAVRLARRFYDSPGFFEASGKSARHPEWSAPERTFVVTGRVQTVAVRLDGRLQLALCVNGREVHRQEWMHDLSRQQLYHKNLTLADAVAVCYCWQLLNVVQPSYGATRSLFVPDERNGFIPAPSSQQLRVFGAYSRRIHQGMVRLTAQSTDPDLLVAAFSAGGGRATLVILNRSVRPALLKLDWPNVRLTTLELADPYHQNAVQPLPARPAEVTVAPGAIVSLTNVKLKL